MNLSSEMSKYAMASLMGAIGGLAWQYGRALTDKYPVHKLDPQPEAFNGIAYDIFAKLNQYKNVSPTAQNAYRDALRRTDALLQLQKVLTDEMRPEKPIIQDKIRAETYAEVAIHNANVLLDCIKDPSATIEVTKHVNDLQRLIEHHLGVINHLCEQCIP